jgi:hypothetical protein
MGRLVDRNNRAAIRKASGSNTAILASRGRIQGLSLVEWANLAGNEMPLNLRPHTVPNLAKWCCAGRSIHTYIYILVLIDLSVSNNGAFISMSVSASYRYVGIRLSKSSKKTNSPIGLPNASN